MPALIGAPGLAVTATDLAQGKGCSVGAITFDDAGNAARFVYAGADCSQYMWVTVLGSGTAIPLNGSNGLQAGEIGVAHYDNIASGEYGWVVVAGRPLALVGASCTPSLPIYTTDTAGVVDDATASGSQFNIVGVLTTGATASAGVTAVRVVLNFGASLLKPRTSA